MTHRVRIPFEPTFKVAPESGGQRPAWMIDRDGMVYLRCPHGYTIGTPSLHSIDADGTVNASIDSMHHTRGDCDWHVMGVLDGWIDGSIAAGEPKFAPQKAITNPRAETRSGI